MNKSRIYKGSDARLIETSRTIHALFVSNLADFTAFDAKLNAAYAAQWKDLMDRCTAKESNSLLLSRQTQITAAMQDKMKQARKKYQMIKYFASEAFNSKPEIMNEFGAAEFKMARNSQPVMIFFLKRLHTTAEKYKPELLAAGCSESVIDSIKTTQEELESTNITQDSYIQSRPVITTQRLDMMNECFRTLSRVVNAAKVVYFDDEAKAGQFMLSNYFGSSDASGQLIQGMVGPGSRKDVFTRPFDAKRVIIIRNQGPQPLMFYFCNEIPTPLGTPLNVPPDNEIHVQASQLATEGNIFAVYNANNELQGEFEVEIS